MKSRDKLKADAQFNERLATGGFRFTPQREHVYDVLLQKRDHPTAESVFIRAKEDMPDISMATVYNCLDALVKCGLVRAVHRDRGATQFCPNMHEHCHFYCEACGGVFDIDFMSETKKPEISMPKGFQATQYEVSIRGLCPECGATKK